SLRASRCSRAVRSRARTSSRSASSTRREMPEPAANVYRVERDTADTPTGRKNPLGRMIATGLTGLPMPASKLKWDATLRIVDDAGAVVYETSGDQSTLDALELQI